MKHIPGNILSPLHWYTIRLSLKPMKDRQGVHVVLADKKIPAGYLLPVRRYRLLRFVSYGKKAADRLCSSSIYMYCTLTFSQRLNCH